jgi:hypothetical protein
MYKEIGRKEKAHLDNQRDFLNADRQTDRQAGRKTIRKVQ